MSSVERPWLLKEEISALRLDVGAGMLLFAPLKLAVFESLRPSCTVHDGPPNCSWQKKLFIITNNNVFL